MAYVALTSDNDTYDVAAAGDIANGLDGNDVIFGDLAAVTIYGDAGDDSLILGVNAAGSTLDGGDGDDRLYSNAATATLRGGNGDDAIIGGAGNEIIIDDAGSTIFAGGGADTITVASTLARQSAAHGGLGNDKITATGDNGSWYGDDGNDRISSAGQGHKVFGGAGNDLLVLDMLAGSAAGGAGNDTIYAGHQFAFSTGVTVNAVTIDAGAGNDLVKGAFSYGTLMGGSGADRFDLIATGEDISGGAGNDWIHLDNASAQVVASGDAGNDTLVFVITNAAGKVDKNIEFRGGGGHDTYELDSKLIKVTELSHGGWDMIQTGKFSIVLADYANVEAAKLTGAASLNLTGDAGVNGLHGNAGDNVITGGGGVDWLTGGAGKDVFMYGSVAESGSRWIARDFIMDFTSGEDRIDLSAVDAATDADGNNAFTFIGSDEFHHKAGELHIWQWDRDGTDRDWTCLGGDVDGDGVADIAINLKGIVNLSAADLVL